MENISEVFLVAIFCVLVLIYFQVKGIRGLLLEDYIEKHPPPPEG